MKSMRTATELRCEKTQVLLVGQQEKIICKGWCPLSDHTATFDSCIVSGLGSRFMDNDMETVSFHMGAPNQ